MARARSVASYLPTELASLIHSAGPVHVPPERIDSCDAEVGRRLRPGPASRPEDAVGREAEEGKFGALAEREGPADCGRRMDLRRRCCSNLTDTV